MCVCVCVCVCEHMITVLKFSSAFQLQAMNAKNLPVRKIK